jgi:hypothetical protein
VLALLATGSDGRELVTDPKADDMMGVVVDANVDE